MSLWDRDYIRDKGKSSQFKFSESKGEIELDGDKKNINQSSSIRKKVRDTQNVLKARKTQNQNTFSFMPWILVIIIILVISKVIYKHSSNEQTSPIEQSLDIIKPIVPSETLLIPPTSVLSTAYDTTTATCPFTMIADNSNYYVKLCDATNENKVIAKFFIRSRETLSTKIPAGQYRVKYGSGDTWKGEKELFGPYSQYGKSETLAFYYDGFSSQGHTISFNKSADGNFKTNNVGRDYILQD